MKYLEMLVASLFAFLFTRLVGAVVAPPGGRAKAADRTEPRRPMVRCASCGVYVLRERALPASRGAFVCSTTCANRR